MIPDIQQKLISGEQFDFEQLALEVFRFQSKHNPVYAHYINMLNLDINNVSSLTQIPFLPIECFKYHNVVSTQEEASFVFQSSGTTKGANARSKHQITNLDFYKKHSVNLYEQVFGSLKNTAVLCYVPSYHENPQSSLLFMLQHFIEYSSTAESGFYSFKSDELIRNALNANALGKKVVIFGVTYALLELAAKKVDLSFAHIIETGGMKGKHKEQTRSEVHETLCAAFNTNHVSSEYGMTELLSQFYSLSEGIFKPHTAARVIIRSPEDPFHLTNETSRGALNIIDMANVHSCSFIATDDVGELLPDGSFKVTGRLDTAEVRGCNLLML
jgi:hypothetical protein